MLKPLKYEICEYLFGTKPDIMYRHIERIQVRDRYFYVSIDDFSVYYNTSSLSVTHMLYVHNQRILIRTEKSEYFIYTTVSNTLTRSTYQSL